MRKRRTIAATVVAAIMGAVTNLSPLEAGEIGVRPPFAPGALPADPIAVSRDDYDGYIYGPLPYRHYFAADGTSRSRVLHRPHVAHALRVRHVARVHHVVRAHYAFDPYYGGGPFYHRHYCCRYW